MFEYLKYIFDDQLCMFWYLKTPDDHNLISGFFTKIGLDSYF